ncbi:probable transcriptional regulatory protein [marine actinobacterium PHSC20C1]|nr:probable transcriptional regulatory protein [marine actinobacterium PHSC20C1]
MRSTLDDSTTRARIRDAAILLIGRNGFAATSARAVAAQAGVSAGLVIHHFGSMRELKNSCDDFIIAEIAQRKTGMGADDVNAAVQEWYADLDRYQPWLSYLGRLFTDDSEAGADLFDRFVVMSRSMLDDGVAHDQVRPSADEHARAVLLVTHSLSSVILQGHIARSLGSQKLSLASLSRMGNAALEVYTEGIYLNSSVLDATRDATVNAKEVQLEKGQGSGPTS